MPSPPSSRHSHLIRLTLTLWEEMALKWDLDILSSVACLPPAVVLVLLLLASVGSVAFPNRDSTLSTLSVAPGR